MLGHPQNRPQLNGDSLDVGLFEQATFRNLALHSCRIGSQAYRKDSPVTLDLSNIRQWGETQVRNGVSNPHGLTRHPWTVTVWNFEGSGMGDAGNTVHQFYIEGRPTLDLRAQQRAHPGHARVERDQVDDAARERQAQPAVGVGNAGAT